MKMSSSDVQRPSSSLTLGEPGTAIPERRLGIAAFLSLFGILAAQALLETARDSLFLTHVPIGRLPWLYLAMAALTLAITGLAPGRGRRNGGAVSLYLLVGAALTAALALALNGTGHAPVYLLFLWSGVFSGFTVTQVWIVLAEALDLSTAKRLYGRLAAGGGLGAVAGALAARLMADIVHPRHMVLLAAAIAAGTALGPGLALRGGAPRGEQSRRPRSTAARRRLARLVENPYVTRLLVLALLAAAVSTLLDFSFKEALAVHLPASRLPAFFASFQLATSVGALVVQLFGVALLIRAVGVGRVQILLPAVLLLGLAATLLTGGLGAIVLLRGLETSLRTSFQRPTFELLQVPLADRLRRKAKPMIDAIGLRGGQALAGVALLAMVHLAAGAQVRLGLAAVLLAIWLIVAVGLGRRYLDLLRSNLLSSGMPSSSIAPLQLDNAARATLVAATDGVRGGEVLAAIDLLVAYGQARFISPRMLDHPDAAVVRRAIEVLPTPSTPRGMAELLGGLDRLLGHADVAVRKAALRRRTVLAPDRAALVRLARKETGTCPTLRAMALVTLVDLPWAPAAAKPSDDGGPDARQALAELCGIAREGTFEVRLAVAEAIADRPSRRFEAVLLQLAASAEPEVLAQVAATLGALGALGAPAALSALIAMLGRREARAAARGALTRLGTTAFGSVAAALTNESLPLPVRANVPRALVEIDADRALGALVDGLLVEEDGFVRFRILRALNRLRRVRPTLEIDEDVLGRAAVAAAESAYRYLAWRIFLEEGAARRAERRTSTWTLLRDLLWEKEQNAVERLFRVLALRYPREDFRKLLRALRSGGQRTRATGRELIENLLSGPAQALTLALIDGGTDRQKLAALAKEIPAASHPGSRAAAPLHVRTAGARRAPAYRDLLAAIRAEEEGGTLAALAAHHAVELAEPGPGAAPVAPELPDGLAAVAIERMGAHV